MWPSNWRCELHVILLTVEYRVSLALNACYFFILLHVSKADPDTKVIKKLQPVLITVNAPCSRLKE